VSDGGEDNDDEEGAVKAAKVTSEETEQKEESDKAKGNGVATCKSGLYNRSINFDVLLAAESKETNEAKTSSGDTEREAGEVPDAPRALHRTLSIFFRRLAMPTTKEDLENVWRGPLCRGRRNERKISILFS
jgi:hypothetical protein